MGVPYLLPVNPIVKYRPAVDEQMVPVAEVPPQDIAPWRDALARLLTDRAHYEEIAAQSRAAALEYARNLNVGPFEEILLQAPRFDAAVRAALPPSGDRGLASPTTSAASSRSASANAPPAPPGFPASTPSRAAALLVSPCRRRHRTSGRPGFHTSPSACPAANRVSPRRPSNAWRRWSTRSPTRSSPTSTEPFAFFGHSMGAVVAFELARELRRRGRAAARDVLIASAARAPQFRRNHVPPARAAPMSNSCASSKHPAGARPAPFCPPLRADTDALPQLHLHRGAAARLPDPRLRRHRRSEHPPRASRGLARADHRRHSPCASFPAATSICNRAPPNSAPRWRRISREPRRSARLARAPRPTSKRCRPRPAKRPAPRGSASHVTAQQISARRTPRCARSCAQLHRAPPRFRGRGSGQAVPARRAASEIQPGALARDGAGRQWRSISRSASTSNSIRPLLELRRDGGALLPAVGSGRRRRMSAISSAAGRASKRC